MALVSRQKNTVSALDFKGGNAMQDRAPVRQNLGDTNSDDIQGGDQNARPKKTVTQTKSIAPTPSTTLSGRTHGPPMVLSNRSNIPSNPGRPAPQRLLQSTQDHSRTENLDERDFKAFGIDAHPTIAHIREICMDFILADRDCRNRTNCFRIHPKDIAFFVEKLKDRDSLYLFRAGMVDTPLLPQPSNAFNKSLPRRPIQSSTASSTTSEHPIVGIRKPLTRNPGWDPTTGDWNFALDQDVWLAESSTSSENGDNILSNHSAYQPSRNSSDTEEEEKARKTFYPPAQRPVRPRGMCYNYQRGSCLHGSFCQYDHREIPPNDQAKRHPANLPSQNSSLKMSGPNIINPGSPIPLPPNDQAKQHPANPPSQNSSLKTSGPNITSQTPLPPNNQVRQQPANLPFQNSLLKTGRSNIISQIPLPPNDQARQHPANLRSQNSSLRTSGPSNIHPRSQIPLPPPISNSSLLRSNNSNLGPSARIHPQHSNLDPGVPMLQEDCSLWLRGKCFRGKTCWYRHPEIQVAPAGVNRTAPSGLPEVRHPRPPHDQVCKNWLRGECMKGHECVYVHEDVTYDDSVPRRTLIQVPVRTEPEVFSTVIYKHIKIKLTDGYEVTEVVTGFETSWIYIGNVPKHVQEGELMDLCRSHGEIIDLRMPEKSVGSLMTVKARFVDAAEASRVCSILDGLEALDSTLTARLSINVNAEANTHLNDTSVRISWETPSKTAFAGFSTQQASSDVLEKCRYTPLGKSLLKASIHTGLPAVGRFNIRLDGVPAETSTDEMQEFLGADGVMWSKPNYASHIKALQGIQKMLKNSGVDLLDFEIMAPPYRSGIMVGWAHLPAPAQAKVLCDFMHGRKPFFTGNTRIFARHIQSLEYMLPLEVYEKSKKDIEALAASAWRMGRLNVSCRTLPNSASVRLGAEDMQGLSKLKAELDVILSGEVVREKGKVVWEGYFAQPFGREFIYQLERQYAPLSIAIDKFRKTIRLFGTSTDRLAVKMKILEKAEILRKQKVRTIELDARLLGVFMKEGMAQLSKELGEECVQLDLWKQALTIRGDQHAYNTAFDAVIRARRAQVSVVNGVTCPVCFDTAATPITLCCGHSWCKACLVRYMMTAIDQKYFPLTCLGDDAKCKERIPMSCANQLLPPSDFEALVEAAFSAHVHRHLDEFSYCPTPDCQQIYRHVPRKEVAQPSKKKQPSSTSSKKVSPSASSPPSVVSVGAALQCPSCLVRICASCQTEAHDGLVCVRPEEGDSLFEEWMKNNDVKPCPGCKMPIEKAMGCHHVTCTVCSIHLCWVCLTPFHNGAGVYSHMLAIHGSFV